MEPKNKLAASLGAFLRGLCDLMLLNIIWFICSVPVFTVGPATSALSRVMINMTRDESAAPIREFFISFRRDFWKAVALGLLGLVGLAIVASDFVFAVSLDGWMKTVFMIVAILVGCIVFSYIAYVFSLHAFYENSISGYIKNALSLAAAMPGETLLIWLCLISPVAVYLLLPQIVLAYIGFLYILFAVSGPAYFAAKHQTKVISKFDISRSAANQETED